MTQLFAFTFPQPPQRRTIDVTGMRNPIALEREAVEATAAELTMLRGFVGDVLLAHGWGTAGHAIAGLDAGTLAGLTVAHGIVKTRNECLQQLSGPGMRCIREGMQRAAAPPQ